MFQEEEILMADDASLPDAGEAAAGAEDPRHARDSPNLKKARLAKTEKKERNNQRTKAAHAALSLKRAATANAGIWRVESVGMTHEPRSDVARDKRPRLVENVSSAGPIDTGGIDRPEDILPSSSVQRELYTRVRDTARGSSVTDEGRKPIVSLRASSSLSSSPRRASPEHDDRDQNPARDQTSREASTAQTDPEQPDATSLENLYSDWPHERQPSQGYIDQYLGAASDTARGSSVTDEGRERYAHHVESTARSVSSQPNSKQRAWSEINGESDQRNSERDDERSRSRRNNRD